MWLPQAGWCSVGKDPGKLGEQEQQVPLPLPALGPVHLVSPRLCWAIWSGPPGTGNELHHHVALRGLHGLAWFIRPGAAPPCCPVASPSAYPKSPPPLSPALLLGAITADGRTHSIHPFVHHSLIRSFVHSVNNDRELLCAKHCCRTGDTAESQKYESLPMWSLYSGVLVGTGNKHNKLCGNTC